MIPIDHHHRWNVLAAADTAWVDYLPGLQQAGHWNSGVGGGIYYNTPTWKVLLGYGYGVDAVRSHGVGAQSIMVLLQFDLGQAREARHKSE